MYSPESFKREIQLFLPGCYPWWSDKYKKWMIVHDAPGGKVVPGIMEYDPIRGKIMVVEMVIEYKDNPVPLSGRTLQAVRIAARNRQRTLNDCFREVDEAEAERLKRAGRDYLLRKRDMGRKIYALDTKRHFIFGRKIFRVVPQRGDPTA